MHGNDLRRNRRHLKETSETLKPDSSLQNTDSDTSTHVTQTPRKLTQQQQQARPKTTMHDTGQVYCTKSDRTANKPVKLDL